MWMVKLSCLDCAHTWRLEISEDSQDEFLSMLGVGNRVPTKCPECGSNRVKADLDS